VVYAEPPYNEGPEQAERFTRSLIEDSDWPGFGMVLALTGEIVVACAYGWTMPAGKWWSRAECDSPAELLDAANFAVIEWMTHPQMRREGHRASVLSTLLGERLEPWATLSSDPRSRARHIYSRICWQ
jgi:hypothetical protein